MIRPRRKRVTLRLASSLSRDLALQLKAADTALKKAAAAAAKMEKGQAAVRTTRGSRDLVRWIGKAGDAVKKAKKLAPRSRGSRDL